MRKSCKQRAAQVSDEDRLRDFSRALLLAFAPEVARMQELPAAKRRALVETLNRTAYELATAGAR